MAVVTRLITHADLDEANSGTRQISVSARLEAELSNGRRLVLLNDRGWSSSGGAEDIRAQLSVEDIMWTTQTVVGPDEPFDGKTQQQMASDHWASLAGILRGQNVNIDAPELERLPHDVVLSERLRAWIA